MKKLLKRSQKVVFALGFALLTPGLFAAGVVLESGREIEGDILRENEEEIVLDTEYGELRFMKMNLDSIVRGAGMSGQRSAGGSPSGSSQAAATDDPFGLKSSSSNSSSNNNAGGGGGSSQSNPFGGGNQGSSSGDSALQPSNPFGGSGNSGQTAAGNGTNSTSAAGEGSSSARNNPFGQASSSSESESSGNFSPFQASSEEPGQGSSRLQQQGEQSEDVAIAVPEFDIPDRENLPEVEMGYDAVVYGMTEELPVEVKTAQQAAWNETIQDKQLEAGSHIRTNQTPISRLLLRDKRDELRLPPKSHVELKELSSDMEQVSVYLHSGSVWSEVSPRNQPDAFRIETPELTAGVRGTNFRVDRLSGASKVSVFEGAVRVVARKTGVHVTLDPNEAAVVNANGQILDLIATPVDEKQIWNDWNAWAQQTVTGSGSLAASFSPINSLSQQVAQDNARWEADMREYMQNTAELKYMEKLDEYANAFEQFAQDTGYIPENEEGWSMLKFDPGIQGWNGPYVEGPVPPLDPWQNPLIYKKLDSPSGRKLGRVYSVWRDGRDQGGTNASVDKISHIMYFQLPRFQDDPEVNPQN